MVRPLIFVPTLFTILILFASARAAPGGDEANPGLPPVKGDDLSERAAQLFEAIKDGKPELAEGFFFPREPFLSLKDVHDPGRYHDELIRAYRHDIKELHGRRRNWDGAVLRGLSIEQAPRRVRPGQEYNKIGYYRTLNARLNYDIGERSRFLEVHTLISWDGHWYVTHLSAIRH